MKCPKCDNTKRFRLCGWSLVQERWEIEVYPDGKDYSIEHIKFLSADHHHVYPDTEIECLECQHEGTVKDFRCTLLVGWPEVKAEA